MHYLLLDLATFAVGANSLIVSAVLLTVPLYLDGSYVDSGSCVVFIIDTTQLSTIQGRVQLSIYLPLTSRRKWVVAVAVFLANLALSVMQEELSLVLTSRLFACLLSFLLSRVYG
jgi:hypothetical protein